MAAGKPEAATIQLKAFQEGDQVVIEVSDDGKGIDPTVIRLKAFEKGMITEEQVDTLSDQEAINLIFLPGFSTNEQVSDLSGRGVGLDVVRTAVEKFNGQATVSSRKGEGSIGAPVFAAQHGRRQGDDGRGRRHRVRRAHGWRCRDGAGAAGAVSAGSSARKPSCSGMPSCRWCTCMPCWDCRASTTEVDAEAVLVARVGGGLVGLVVDRFREGIDVILKPLEGMLAGMRVYSGSALLGDGRVLLVLNLKELL